MRYLAIVGLMALLAVPALAAEKTINVSVNVKPILVIDVVDAALVWTTSGITPWQNDLAGMDPATTRAKFKVTANADYTLEITSGNGTWQTDPSDVPWGAYPQVKFISDTNSDTFIGGSLYLDYTPETGGGDITYPNFYYWTQVGPTITLDQPHIMTADQPAGVHTWAISASFNTQAVGDGSNPNGIPDVVAPQDTYSTNAVITASVLP